MPQIGWMNPIENAAGFSPTKWNPYRKPVIEPEKNQTGFQQKQHRNRRCLHIKTAAFSGENRQRIAVMDGGAGHGKPDTGKEKKSGFSRA